MRLFLAIELEPELADALSALQRRLQERAPDAKVRWVEPENFHLTVQFLGEIAESSLPGVIEACDFLVPPRIDFRIGIGGASYFPKKGPLKTLWVGLTEGFEEWKLLVEAVEPWMEPLGAPKHGGLVPHITLGRVKEESEALRSALAAETLTECGVQWARRLTLIESFLGPEGATYDTRGTWSFKRNF